MSSWKERVLAAEAMKMGVASEDTLYPGGPDSQTILRHVLRQFQTYDNLTNSQSI